MIGIKLLAATFATTLLAGATWGRQPLGFEERVKAQEAIERVCYAHRIWPKENPTPKPAFEKMVSSEMLEANVAEYLKQSEALDKFWQRPITTGQLQAEMDRMAKQTKDPVTLQELFGALHNDPYLIAECLVRPILADRLIHNRYSSDTRFHAQARAKAEQALEEADPSNLQAWPLGQFSKTTFLLKEEGRSAEAREPRDRCVIELDAEAFTKVHSLYASAKGLALREEAESFVVFKTAAALDSEIVVERLVFSKTTFGSWWSATEGTLDADPFTGDDSSPEYTLPSPRQTRTACTDSWANSSLTFPAPDARECHTAVWTGTEMIVWGGHGDSGYDLITGGRYNPATDTWTATSTGANCPSARAGHTAIWTGTEMIIWGGAGLNTGGRYNPSTNAWTATSVETNCPTARSGHTAVWTGTEMLVWGGETGGGYLDTGGRYNPSADTWTPTSLAVNCPSARTDHTAVWNGTAMIVWGGKDGSGNLNTGGRYRPSADTWTAVSAGTNCPSARSFHSAVWTGTYMVVWGGEGNSAFAEVKAIPNYLNTGGRYNPSTNTWTATSVGTNCPSAREQHTVVWTNTEMIVWGGRDGSGHAVNAGGRYKPSTDSWTVTSVASNCPSARAYHTAVWTGTEMIVWGGCDDSGHFMNSGGRYASSTNEWVATSTGMNCPTERRYHTAVWTGAEMIIWGGGGPYGGILNTGGCYRPATDSWVVTSTGTDCPFNRESHIAVWTGTEMIIWGGDSNGQCNTGARYNPASDAWVATSTGTNCPSARWGHTAVWSGTEMIVWGGYGNVPPYYFNTGGRYNPATDGWTATSLAANCPSGRCAQTVVWTGKEMIVWGGYGSTAWLNTGGRYNPTSDSWVATATGANCPSTRVACTALWTGTEMIVWGGFDGNSNSHLNTGGRYNPSTDAWTATSTGVNCPVGAGYYGAVWTGAEAIVWGGAGDNGYLNTGGRYNPATDSWTATSMGTNCPFPRDNHTVVWTGTEMIVWGGEPLTATGGVYRPYSSVVVTVPEIIGCPPPSATLTAASSSSYQWLRNGLALAGATSQSYQVTVSGTYRVMTTDASGCIGTSSDIPLAITFCSQSEVSPQQAIFPARLVRDGAASTGYYIYFQSIGGTSGYNIYEGSIGSWYSHGGAAGNACNATVTDLGTGEMRAAVTPSAGNHYYLVTAFNATTEGPSGFASSGTQIPASQSTCSP